MKTVFSRYFEFERDVPLDLYLNDGKIQTYSTDFKEVFSNYIKSQARFLSTAEEFPEFTMLSGKYTLSKGKDVRNWVNSEQQRATALGGYVKKGLSKQLYGDFDITTEKTGKFLKSSVGIFGAMGLSSPMSPTKNIIMGDIHTFTAFGSRPIFDSWVKMADRDNWKRSMMQGALDAGTQYMEESGLFNLKTSRAILKYSGMTISEKANRVRSRLAGRFWFENAVKVLRGESQKFIKPSKKSIVSKLKDTFQFTDKEIAFIEKYGIEKHHIPKDAPGYVELLRQQRWMNDKADVMAHVSTQGMTSTPFMPLFASKTLAKPFLLFYRMAYASNTNLVNNVIKPMQKGNMFPMMRYVAALGIGGEMLWSLYDHVLGIDRPSENVMEHFIEDAVRAEMLGLGTNFVSSYSTKPGFEGIVDSYTPFMVRSLMSLLNTTTSVIAQEPFAYDKVDKTLQDILVGYKHAKQAINKRSNSYMTHRKNAKTHEIAFLKKTGKKNYLQLANMDEKYMFYNAMSKSFQLAETRGDYLEAAKKTWAAYNYVKDKILMDAVGEVDGWSKTRQEEYAHQQARKTIKGIMKRWKPFKWSDESPEGRQMWSNFLKNKTPEQKEEFKKIKAQYHYKYRQMERAWLDTEKQYNHRYIKPNIEFNMKDF